MPFSCVVRLYQLVLFNMRKMLIRKNIDRIENVVIGMKEFQELPNVNISNGEFGERANISQT